VQLAARRAYDVPPARLSLAFTPLGSASSSATRVGLARRRLLACGAALALLVVACLALLPASALAQAAPTKHALFGKTKPAAGDYEEWLLQDGQPRTFRVHIPPRYNQSTPLPLLIVLHDEGGDARSAQAVTRIDPEADKTDFIVAYPNATGTPTRWNAPGCNGTPVEKGTADLASSARLSTSWPPTSRLTPPALAWPVSATVRAWPWRRRHSFPVGWPPSSRSPGRYPAASGGGPLVSLPTVFSPVSVLAVYAQDDTGQPNTASTPLLPVTETLAYMARLNRCGATASRDGASTDAVSLHTYSGCLDAVDVVLYTLASGGHAWPKGRLLGDATVAGTILDFLVRHPKS